MQIQSQSLNYLNAYNAISANSAKTDAAIAQNRIDLLDNKFQNIEQRLNKIDTKLDSIGAL